MPAAGPFTAVITGQGMSRIHGALITETEIQRIVDFVKEQGSPEYKTSILETSTFCIDT